MNDYKMKYGGAAYRGLKRVGVKSMEFEYFKWLIDSIDPYGTARDYYQPVLEELYLRDFEWGPRFQDDENRARDGLMLREIYASERGMPVSEIGIDGKKCSCLEMMIGIARRIEFEILAWPGQENIPRWFWNFIENMGLIGYREFCLIGSEKVVIENRISNWLSRKYSRNGEGGIFVVHDPYFDMRKMPIWKQMSAVLNEYEE